MQKSYGTHPRPACGGALQIKNRVSQSSKLVSTLCFWFFDKYDYSASIKKCIQIDFMNTFDF